MKFWKSYAATDERTKQCAPEAVTELPIVTIDREPMPLRYRDLNENDVFEIADCLFVRMDDGDAYCFSSGMTSYIKKGRHKIDDMQIVRFSIHIQAHVQGSQVWPRPNPK